MLLPASVADNVVTCHSAATPLRGFRSTRAVGGLRGCEFPLTGTLGKFMDLFRPIVQCCWIKVSPVGPYQRMDLHVELNSVEYRQVT